MGLQAGRGLALVPNTLASFQDFGIPSSNAIVDSEVMAFNVANLTIANGTHRTLAPVLPGRESITTPLHSFFIQHKSRNQRLMFDLGLRNDPLNFPPSVSAFFADAIFSTGSFKDITELLQDGGIPLETINAVIWSHSHVDHIGDMSKFPHTTDLVIGPGTNNKLYPQFPDGVLQTSDFAGHNVTELNFDNTNLTFGAFKAIDYFGDASFYLLNTPGHLPGHMTALARVTPTSFILLSGDSFHHPGQLHQAFNNLLAGACRRLLRHFPCPAHLLQATKSSISTDYFWSWGTKEHDFDVVSRAESLFSVSDLPDSVYADPLTSKVSLEKVATFDADPDFLVLAAHDQSLISSIPYFPESLNDWKAKNRKQNLVWRFVDESSPAFMFNPL
ncbi:beta-lactamase-like protein [Mycena sp. CBHHK59/15]|nr:beta-lactamase-like protein [Mycena sp. CBHHK59/15]